MSERPEVASLRTPSFCASRITGTSGSERVVPTGPRSRARSNARWSYVRSSFFYGRTFTSDEDLNRQARHWLDHVANVRTHGTLKERPADRFEHERDLLRPLASRPYRSLVLPPEVIQQAKAVLPRIDVERRSLEAYAQVAGGVR